MIVSVYNLVLLILPFSIATHFNQTIVYFDPFISVEDVLYLQPYNEDKLIQLLQTVSTRFSHLMVPIYSNHSEKRNFSSLENIPSIVANHNQLLDYWKSSLQIYLVYINAKGKLSTNILRLKKIADSANTIDPTVKPILLEHFSILPESLSTIPEVIKSNIQPYKYGIIFPFSLCSRQKLQTFSTQPDILIFHHSPVNDDVEAGNIRETISKTIASFESCKSRFPASLPVGFLTSYPDTSENATINYSNLFHYWGNLSSWAEASKTMLTFHSAFDTIYDLYDQKVSSKTSGYWKVAENTSGVFTFTEKSHLFSQSEEMERLSKNISWLLSSSKFSRQNIIVRFDPFVSNGKHGQWKSSSSDYFDLKHLFLQVTTKLSKIIIHEISLRKDDPRLKLIPEVVSETKRFNGDPKDGPLEVILTVRDIKDWDETEAIALEANAKNPATVNMFMIQVTDEAFPEYRMQQLIKLFRYARQRLDNHAIGAYMPYQLGGMFLSEKCFIPEDSPEFKNELIPFLKFIDKIFFMELIDIDLMRLGVDKVIQITTTRFLNCRRKVKGAKESIEVGLLTGWHDTDSNGKQSYAQQVLFWEKINDWAVETNTQVIFIEAFDNLHKGDGGTVGWWNLVENDSYQSVQEYQFLDKKELALNYALGKPNATNEKGLGPTAIIGIVTIIILLIPLVYLTSLAKSRKSNAKIHLTEEDLEFFEGCDEDEKPILLGVGSDEENASEYISRPYNKEKYELIKSSFVVDDRAVLGSGEFGKVCRGTVTLSKFEDNDSLQTEQRPVAVKMLNPKCSDPKTALQGLLTEIKILSYLGMHKNIVCLIGAYTASISKDNTVYLFLEVCLLGSLESYLRKYEISVQRKSKLRATYINELNDEGNKRYLSPSTLTSTPRRGIELSIYDNVEDSIPSLQYKNIDLAFLDISKDLYRWSKEICCGMEYLASKNVVHMDLATRNVLLTSDKTAKISDFGLSRRLYDYTMYVKSKQEPLPWRWMAPESLKRMIFNERTDVWAFGVTLWEIFTCGEIPYPGLHWDVEFCDNLENGMRMGKPMYCSDEMYMIMHRCWEMDGELRPTFSEIMAMLSKH